MRLIKTVPQIDSSDRNWKHKRTRAGIFLVWCTHEYAVSQKMCFHVEKDVTEKAINSAVPRSRDLALCASILSMPYSMSYKLEISFLRLGLLLQFRFPRMYGGKAFQEYVPWTTRKMRKTYFSFLQFVFQITPLHWPAFVNFQDLFCQMKSSLHVKKIPPPNLCKIQRCAPAAIRV